MFVFSPEEDKQTDGDMSCVGGDVKDKGIAVFEQNAKGGALEGKGKVIVKLRKSIKYLKIYLWRLLRVNLVGVKEKCDASKESIVCDGYKVDS